jgi:hypothetical protein
MGLPVRAMLIMAVRDPVSTPQNPVLAGVHNLFGEQEMIALISADCNVAVDCNGYRLLI